MSFGYEETRLWQISLADRSDDPHQQDRARLRVAYFAVRERAAILAAEIPQDLREYTVHDATHLDALWELADLITGAAIDITPTEGFVLGCAFLLHDLGMGLAAWPGGIADLTNEQGWKDTLATTIGEIRGRPALPAELDNPPDEAIERAKQITLRERHAAHAADLGMISWNAAGTGNKYYLIEDENLRSVYGHLIGKIAASHWWTIDQLSLEFSSGAIGAQVDSPKEWVVDPLKLACILRLSDAAHIDARRAPGFLMALRSPTGSSRHHWTFQTHLQKPQMSGDQLIYTSPQPFTLEESEAWWLCFDTLQMIDRELHSVDAFLADKSLPRMAARSVKGADSPFRLSALIPPAGWTPVDAKVVVSNVPELARKLGGESLYGSSPHVALRELIQNASDATRALASFNGINAPGIKVVLRRASDEWWLDVIDHGIGMSQQVLVGPLLDFGRSYWGSQLMRQESPGLAASGFQPAGRYGIGFYATFMLGDTVNVTSRRFDAAASDTRVLTFPSGLESRPIVRKARNSEVLATGGTIVSVKLKNNPYKIGGILARSHRETVTLKEICGQLAPALSVDLSTVEGDGHEEACISADDWKTMPGEDLIRRVSQSLRWQSSYGTPIAEAAIALRTIERDGQVIARGSLDPLLYIHDPDSGTRQAAGVIVSGGLSVGELENTIGIFLGNPLKADRARGEIIANRDELAVWATEQAQIWNSEINEHLGGWKEYVDFLCLLGANMEGLHVCCNREGYLDADGLREWAASHAEIIVMDSDDVDVVETYDGIDVWNIREHVKVDIGEDTLISFDIDRSYIETLEFGGVFRQELAEAETNIDDTSDYSPHTWWGPRGVRSIDKFMISVIAEVWNLSLDTVLRECLKVYNTPVIERVAAEREVVGVDEVKTTLFMNWTMNKPST